MKRLCLVLIGLCVSVQAEADAQEFWPQWRGPAGTGMALQGDPPVEWSADKNIRWKVDIPGNGFATPIVWGDRVFVSTAVQTDKKGPEQAAPEGGRRGRGGNIEGRGGRGRGRGGQGGSGRDVLPTYYLQYQVMALDRKTGKVLWKRTAKEVLPHQGRRITGSWASPSAVTDGEYIYAYFGSGGLYCYDLDGNLKWGQDLGDMEIQGAFGEGSSPALYGNTLVINWDHQGDSFLLALHKHMGKEIWRTRRDEATTWATPLVVEVGGKLQVIVPGAFTRGYDLATGQEVWNCEGLPGGVIPTAVHQNGMVYVTGTARGSGVLMAIHLEKAQGTIAYTDAVAWWTQSDTPHIPTPLLMGGQLYMLKNRNGILSSLNAKTGEVLYGPQRLEGIQGIYASPAGVKDRIYLASQDGVTLVVKHGPEFEVLASNKLDDSFNASPVIVDNEIYLRGRQHLYCISMD